MDIYVASEAQWPEIIGNEIMWNICIKILFHLYTYLLLGNIQYKAECNGKFIYFINNWMCHSVIFITRMKLTVDPLLLIVAKSCGVPKDPRLHEPRPSHAPNHPSP